MRETDLPSNIAVMSLFNARDNLTDESQLRRESRRPLASSVLRLKLHGKLQRIRVKTATSLSTNSMRLRFVTQTDRLHIRFRDARTATSPVPGRIAEV
jgi:hypothetical protein